MEYKHASELFNEHLLNNKHVREKLNDVVRKYTDLNNGNSFLDIITPQYQKMLDKQAVSEFLEHVSAKQNVSEQAVMDGEEQPAQEQPAVETQPMVKEQQPVVEGLKSIDDKRRPMAGERKPMVKGQAIDSEQQPLMEEKSIVEEQKLIDAEQQPMVEEQPIAEEEQPALNYYYRGDEIRDGEGKVNFYTRPAALPNSSVLVSMRPNWAMAMFSNKNGTASITADNTNQSHAVIEIEEDFNRDVIKTQLTFDKEMHNQGNFADKCIKVSTSARPNNTLDDEYCR